MTLAHCSRLFKPNFPHQPVSMLILVENSQAMSSIWADLRDHYLDPLVGTLQTATNMSAPITVSVLESYPSQEPGTNFSFPRQYNDCREGLQDVKFNFSPENKISAGRINSCIDFLDSAKYQGQSPALHLIVVSATPPSDDDTGTGGLGNSYCPWHFLAQKLADKHIHCHIVVSPDNETGSLTKLFEETLRLQKNVQENFYSAGSPSSMLLKLSVAPTDEQYSDVPSNPYPPQRLVASRRNSYPLDNFHPETFDETGASVPGDADPPPTLVSQLQQVHGLTKKKVYGTKPTRQPFIREERVRDKYRKPPAPLTMPISDPITAITPGGRAMSQSRADRMARVGQASPTDLHSRRQHPWPRRGSRLSTPEPENLAWSPPAGYHDTSPGSSYVSSDLSSPVTPVTTMEEIYSLPTSIAPGPPTSLPSVSPSASAYQIGGMPETNWTQQQQQPKQQPQYAASYNPATSYFAPPPPPQYYSINGELLPENRGKVQPAQRTQAITPYNTYPMSSPPAIVPSQGPAHMIPSNASANTSMHASGASMSIDTSLASYAKARADAPKKQASDEDEERFVFGSDFVAATATLFEEEVLPAYPNYPGMSSGLSTSGMQANLLSSTQPAQAGELYASRVRKSYPPPSSAPPSSASQQSNPSMSSSGYGMPSNGMGGKAYSNYHGPVYAPSYGCSSLTGWAG